MESDFDYGTVPYGFIHCLNESCKDAKHCLRHQVTHYLPSNCSHISIVSPAYIAATNGKCPYFMSDQKAMFALGITHLLDQMPHKDAVNVKRLIIEKLNRSTYYRCWRKERLISPTEQTYIREIFLSKGIKEEPLYDEYIEQYDW